MWIVDENLISQVLKEDFKQDLAIDFSVSKQYIHNQNRYISKSTFYSNLKNGKTQLRNWLIYSGSANALFCIPCKLFGESQPLTTGYTDWSNVNQRLKDHEESKSHKTNFLTFLQRCNQKDVIANLSSQIDNEISYWRNVLQRVVAVIKSLSTRGLAFRGDDERFGSLRNGNFMMCLELVAQFDPFLAKHIETHGNPGKGQVSYLSSTICDEFIFLMAKQVQQKIASEIIQAKYYSISTDSTPDISHIDQLTFIVRYTDKAGEPRERFIEFISKCGHKGKEIADAILASLKKFEIDITDCRGQSYDNASNMSGKYIGCQAIIKDINPKADYLPCSGHSLNLSGEDAVDCSKEAVNFFSYLQQLYN